jgi:trk system potassium uptake protein TrkH
VLAGHGALLLGGGALFLAVEWNGALAGISGPMRPVAALFQSVAARSGGIATVSFADAHAVTLFAWVGLMFIGGASGSTAGGVRLSTIGVMFAAVYSTLRGREEAHIFGRRIETPLIFRALAVVTVMMMVHFTVTLSLVFFEGRFATEGSSFLGLMFEAMSALGTVGVSTGVTPSLSTASKLILCATMFFGRLGPLTVVYALQRRQRPLRYRLPPAQVRIG